MAFNTPIQTYSITIFQDNILDYDYLIRLVLEDGVRVSLKFQANVPSDFLTSTGSEISLVMPLRQYEHVYHLLQTESPVFFTALKLVGISTARLTTSPEPLGEGFGDAETVASLMSLLPAAAGEGTSTAT